MEIRLQVDATIDKEAQNVIVKEEQKWRLVVVRILSDFSLNKIWLSEVIEKS